MARKTGLGRGLDSLIPEKPETDQQGGFDMVDISLISANPRQPRSDFNTDDLNELAASIAEHGILQPLIVTRNPLDERYTLIAGERRLKAAKLANLQAVPVIVREADDLSRLELALIENIQRSDLSPLDTAEAYRQLQQDFNLSHEEISQKVGKSRVSVTNTLRLLNLPQKVKIALLEGRISEGHARVLLALQNTEAQIAAMETVIKKNLSVRQTEELVRRYSGEEVKLLPKTAQAPEITAIEEQLRNKLGTRVNLNSGKKGGSVVIHYYSDEELESILHHLLRE